jgi:AraC family transcriptional regulator
MSGQSNTLMKSSWTRTSSELYGTDHGAFRTQLYDGERGSGYASPAIPLALSSKLVTGTGGVRQIVPTSSGGMNRVGDPWTSCSTLDNTALVSDFLSSEHHPDTRESSSHLQSLVQQVRSVMVELFAALRGAFNDERGSPEERLRRASAILQAVEEPRLHARAYVRGGLAPWQVRKVSSFIETNLEGPIRSKNLASIVRLSPCHFSRVFRNSFGDSPSEYVIRRRIERAKGLMLSTDAFLSQIALDCGFADQAHLCRLFRRIVGESPATWRRARLSPLEPNLTKETEWNRTRSAASNRNGETPTGKCL